MIAPLAAALSAAALAAPPGLPLRQELAPVPDDAVAEAAVPDGWRGAGTGLSVELALAVLFLDDPQGSAFAGDGGIGLRAGYDLNRLLGTPFGVDAPLALAAELLWYHTSFGDDAGTEAVQVATTFDYFALPLRLGWEFGRGGWRTQPYLSAGPAVTWVGTEYTVHDPVAADRGQGPEASSVSGLLPGAAYGPGAAFGWRSEGGSLGVTGRIELLRFRRGANDDLSLGLGLGLLF